MSTTCNEQHYSQNMQSDVICPGLSTDVIGPGMSTDVIGPGMSTDVIGPGMSTDVIGHDVSTDVIGPGVSTGVIGPVLSTDVIGADVSTDLIGPEVSTDMIGANISTAENNPESSPDKNGQVTQTVVALNLGDISTQLFRENIPLTMGTSVMPFDTGTHANTASNMSTLCTDSTGNLYHTDTVYVPHGIIPSPPSVGIATPQANEFSEWSLYSQEQMKELKLQMEYIVSITYIQYSQLWYLAP
jgi:hypothetical protein